MPRFFSGLKFELHICFCRLPWMIFLSPHGGSLVHYHIKYFFPQGLSWLRLDLLLFCGATPHFSFFFSLSLSFLIQGVQLNPSNPSRSAPSLHNAASDLVAIPISPVHELIRPVVHQQHLMDYNKITPWLHFEGLSFQVGKFQF